MSLTTSTLSFEMREVVSMIFTEAVAPAGTGKCFLPGVEDISLNGDLASSIVCSSIIAATGDYLQDHVRCRTVRTDNKLTWL